MTKGTQSFGGRNNKTHTLSRTTGTQSWHKQKKRCASSGHGAGTKKRRYNWSKKAAGRTTQGTGRMRYLKHVARRAKNGFREGTRAKSVKSSRKAAEKK
ncbi:60s ribosomal protein l37 [Stylonychia lemnae]|uniref:60s ribosomal protein l37 n=1 Tax=Stylonychia lemnae TaxID=5949 RepID=A0A078AAC9_STYLE|nr:60s ribosomal protein l37 [Stylonychia lemnae]|eukprot:CDW79144.1 60s ribosomal protein l37 [Stylonychia lemnae]